MNHTRKTESDFITIVFLSILVVILILTFMCPTPAAAQAAELSPDGGRNFAHPAASTPADTGHGEDAPTPDTDTPEPTPGPDPEPEPVNPCGEYAEDGPHPCNDHADPNPPQDGERRR